MPDKKKIIEGLWDCPYCGAKGISGLTKHCPTCGHPQDVGTKFYLGEKKNYLDEEKAEQYGKGADWTCSYCGSLNRYSDEVCSNCGGPREDTSGDYFDNEKKVEEEKRKEEEERQEYLNKLNGNNQPKKRSLFNPFFLIIFALIALMVYMVLPKSAAVRVIDKGWTRSIHIEEQRTLQESDWSVPNGGRVTGERRELHHYEAVLDHYEERSREVPERVYDGEDYHTRTVNNGDGTFSEETYTTPRYRTEYHTEYYNEPVYRNEPRYATKYYYDIDRWVYSRTETSNGTTDEPYWPQLNLTNLERESGNSERYTFTAENKKNQQTYILNIPFSEWENLKVGDELDVTYRNDEVVKINGHEVR